MEFSRINDITKFPLKTSDEEAGQSPKFVGYDDDENIAMRANELVKRGLTDDLANMQALLGIPDRARRAVTHVINGVDLTNTGELHTILLPTGKIFIVDSVIIYITAEVNWTVAGACNAGWTLAADPDANRADWDDTMLSVLLGGFKTETYRPEDTLSNPKDSTAFDMLYFKVGAGATADTLTGTILFNGYEIDTP